MLNTDWLQSDSHGTDAPRGRGRPTRKQAARRSGTNNKTNRLPLQAAPTPTPPLYRVLARNQKQFSEKNDQHFPYWKALIILSGVSNRSRGTASHRADFPVLPLCHCLGILPASRDRELAVCVGISLKTATSPNHTCLARNHWRTPGGLNWHNNKPVNINTLLLLSQYAQAAGSRDYPAFSLWCWKKSVTAHYMHHTLMFL